MIRRALPVLAAVVGLTVLAAGGESRPGEGEAGASPATAVPQISLPIFDAARGLAEGWLDYGWTPHELRAGGPARLDLSGYGGLILARPGLAGGWGGLLFRYRAPQAYGDFLEVRLESRSGEPIVKVRPERRRGAPVADGFTEVWLPMSELNPDQRPFERVTFHAWRKVGSEPVLLDQVGFTAADAAKPAPRRGGRFALDCRAQAKPISPSIYGIAGGSEEAPQSFTMGATGRRWGGNSSSRYNWKLGDAWNTNNDWFFRNVKGSADPDFSYETFLEENRKHGMESALTVPMLGWVAKDTHSYSFPVSVFGPQQATAHDQPDAGNGVGRDGKPIRPGPPTRTSVAAPPEFVEQWVRAIRERDAKRGRSVQLYILDNEPGLWHETHRDVHPEPMTYDELLQKTLAYAAAIRRADPEARIAGPASWGWLEYHYSAADVVAGVGERPDRRRHGDVPLIPWYLRKIREHEQKTGTKVLDVLDVHFYSQAEGVGAGRSGGTDAAAAALRIRSTRALWDPTYVDESWIGERMRVLPLLKQWIAENAPGLGLSIGEWNFGAEKHQSSGLATAEALGRFGTEGVTSAYYWDFPPDRSPVYWAFRAYRNFDGKGGRFQDFSVPADTSASLASLFASRDAEGRKVVAVLLNLDPKTALAARVDLAGCGSVSAARAFTYTGGAAGLQPLPVENIGGIVEARVEPYSLTVLDLAVSPAGR